MYAAGASNLELASSRLNSRRLPVNFALARHQNSMKGNLVGRIAGTEHRVPGRKNNEHRFSTSPLRHEPTALARWLESIGIAR
jgi:hypothetical protein